MKIQTGKSVLLLVVAGLVLSGTVWAQQGVDMARQLGTTIAS